MEKLSSRFKKLNLPFLLKIKCNFIPEFPLSFVFGRPVSIYFAQCLAYDKPGNVRYRNRYEPKFTGLWGKR